MNVGFVGLGTMGGAVAYNLLRAGFDLIVHDIRPQAAEKPLTLGATWAKSPADILNRVEIVAKMVFGPVQIEEVVRGKHGPLAGDCQDKVWIDLTTSRPALMRELAREFGAKGGLSVDAPVTGSVDAAIRGDMIMFVGGEETAVSRVHDILAAVGEIRRVGEYGEDAGEMSVCRLIEEDAGVSLRVSGDWIAPREVETV